MIAGAGFFLHAHKPVATFASTDQPATSSVKSVLHLESFVVNLADPGQNAFLRVGIDLGLSGTSTKTESSDKDSPAIPQVRDALLSVLTTWRSDALLAPEGKARLKEELLRVLRERVQHLNVTAVYFTEFLVQR